jgi:hypothetical protein
MVVWLVTGDRHFAPTCTSAVKVTSLGHQNDRSFHILEIPTLLCDL